MKNKIKSILKKNGFLIVLFICVCVVGVSTIFISTSELVGKGNKDGKKKDATSLKEAENTQLGDEREIIEESIQEVIQVETVVEDLSNELNKEEEQGNEEIAEVFNGEEDEIEFVDDYKEEYKSQSQALIMPIEGEVIQGHSKDTLIYSETLGEWRSHLGIDIKAPIGTKIKAPLDGEVKKAYHDKLWGNVIILDHGNGLETRYANLNTLEMVKEGVKVKQGDYISTVGKSADIEMMVEDHLHYEAIKNGKVMDPRSIIE